MKLENLGIFLKGEEYFLDEFNKVLRLLIFCSQKMILHKKNDLYVKEGIYRLILGKYAEKMPLGGMIGFVQGFKKNSDMSGLVSDIKNTLTENQQIKTIRNLAFYEIDENFKYSYSSQHKRTGKLPKIDLYHLFFDFSKN